jgi:multidrug resistance efflux pump
LPSIRTSAEQPTAPGFPAFAGARNLSRPRPVRPTPLPQRPKGRWFIGAMLVICCSLATYKVWQAYFRYYAYGTVIGRVIGISPSWEGAARSIHVREGDSVRQGQILVSVASTELQHRSAQLQDELVVAQANLEAEMAKLKWQLAFSVDQGQGAVSNYFEMSGRLLQEQAKLDELQSSLKRAELLLEQHAIAAAEVEQLRFNTLGEGKKVAQLKESLGELKKRADLAELLLQKGTGLSKGQSTTGFDQLKPHFARLEALQAERTRLQEQLAQGELRAPTNGHVVKIHRFAGEHCKVGEPVVSLIEEGSLEIVLYLPQTASQKFTIGQEVPVVLDPHSEVLHCTTVRVGDRFEPAPEHLKRCYLADQKLLPVYLKANDGAADQMNLRIGEVVKLPYWW